MEIIVNKVNEKKELLLMKNVEKGHLVKFPGEELYAISGMGETAFLLTFSSGEEWFEIAKGLLNWEVEVLGKIKRATFEVE